MESSTAGRRFFSLAAIFPAMNGLKSVAHVCLKSPDLARTLDFYCGALGMERVFDFTKGGQVVGFYLRLAERSFVEVFQADKVVAPGADAALHHFCLETDDMAAVRGRLAKGGFAPEEIRTGADETLQFWVTDPSGVRFEFHQYTEHSAQFAAPGGSVEVNW